MKEVDTIALKEKIKERRLELDLTLEDVAQVVGVTRQTVQKYESGVVSNIPSDKIELLAKALKTTPAYLMGWENKVEETTNAGNHFDFSQLTEEQQNILGLLEPLTIDQQKLIVATARAIAEEIIAGRDKK